MSKSNGAKKLEVKLYESLPEKQADAVEVLKILLADEAVLYTKLRNYHWNVRGIYFYPLHTAFEDQYDEIALIIDEVAERIRQCGKYAPGTMDEFIRKARLSEAPGVYPDAETMVINLVKDHETIIRGLYKDIATLSAKAEDVGVVDLLTRLLQQHEKMAWMLRMCMEGQIVASKK